MDKKIVFFGSGSYVLPIIETLKNPFDLVLVVTTEKNSTDPVVKYCNSNNIQVISVESLSNPDVKGKLLNVKCQLAVLASFGLIIPNSVLNMFELGIINIHPSLLPKFRGPTPVQSAIIAGETTTGVSIMKLDSEVDHGPILVQKEIEIEPSDTSESLYKKSFELGSELLIEVLPKYISGELTPVEQDHSKATYTDHLTRKSGYLDINNQQSIINNQLSNMIRAYYPWPGVWLNASLNGTEKIIKLLPEDRIQVEGKNIMSFKDFMNGYSEGREILEKLDLYDAA